MKSSQRADEDLSKLERLSRAYINYGNKYAEVELSEMRIDGKDFIKLLNNLEIETEKETLGYCNLKVHYEELTKEYEQLKQNYEKLDEDYKGLLNSLESFQKNPIFSSVSALMKIIQEAEKKIEERRIIFRKS